MDNAKSTTPRPPGNVNRPSTTPRRQDGDQVDEMRRTLRASGLNAAALRAIETADASADQQSGRRRKENR
jgi:hypothetical protein